MDSKDVILNEDRDLLIENGDFVVGRSEEQEIDLIVSSSPGNWRQWPLIGLPLLRFLRSQILDSQLFQEIETQLRLDGFEDVKVKRKSGLLTIDGKRRS